MSLSQIGMGDRQTVGRLMSRLTMAKILNLMGHDTNDFIFSKVEYTDYSYYPIEAAMGDIREFLDTVGADYQWDEDDYDLTLYFSSDVKNIESLAKSIAYGWDEIEFNGYELDEIVEYLDNGLRFHLSEYDGVPIKFFTGYYELLKENNLI